MHISKYIQAVDQLVSPQSIEAFSLVDSQNFLVRHRRNRVYGVATVNSGTQTESDFDCALQSALKSMQTHCHFSMEETFDTSLEEESLHLERVQNKFQEALEAAEVVSYLGM